MKNSTVSNLLAMHAWSAAFAFVLGLLLVGVPHVLGVTDAVQGRQSVQIEVGEDVYLPCEAPSNAQIYIWERDNRSVHAINTFRDNRLYVLRVQGLLILNSVQNDEGVYRCSYFARGSFGAKEYDLRIVASDEPDENSEVIECGYVKLRSRVIGGREVNAPGQFPWMVLLWNKALRGPFCGGALLSRRFVLTAAHCFQLTGYNANQIEVRLGEYNTSSTESYERTIDAAELIRHPNYNADTYDSDILLIRLAEPVIFSDYIVPICLPSELRGETLLQTGQRGTVAGWGSTDGTRENHSNVLKKAKLTIRDFSTCSAQHSRYTLTSNMFCALGGNRATNVRDACNGDSGGPFIVESEERSYVVGIVSWGVGCGDINRPGVYTRVSRFRSWILQHINADLQTCEETSFQIGEDLNQDQSKIQSLEDQVQSLESQLEMFQSQDENVCTTPTPYIPPTTIAPYIETSIPCRRGACWHVGGYRVWGQCVNGVCECNAPYYNRVTCLPSVESCQIRENDVLNNHAIPTDSRSQSLTTYSCLGNLGRTSDVHMLSVYEGNVHDRPPRPGTMNVLIPPSSATTRPVVLVLANYEPVNWVLDIPPSLTIEKVILISYYVELSSVTVAEGIERELTVEKKPRSTPRGYGKDSGGGNTPGMMLRLSQIYGSVTSFAGTYRAESWNWTLPVGHNTSPVSSPVETAGGSGASSGASANINENTWTEFSFRADNNWNSCHGSKYVRKRTLDDGKIGQFVGAVLCSSTRYKLFLSDDLDGIFHNIADTNDHGGDHCELVGAPRDGEFNLDSNFWHSPTATGYYRSSWGDDMQLGIIGGGMGSSWTGRYYPKWYECGVAIP